MGFLPVNIDAQFRFVEFQVYIYKAEGGVLVGGFHKTGQGFPQLAEVGRL